MFNINCTKFMKMKHLLLKLMRYSLFLTLTLSVALGAAVADNAVSQTRNLKEVKVTFAFENQDLSSVFDVIEAKTGFTFAFDNKEKIGERRVTLSVRQVSMVDLLLLISKEAKVKFMQVDEVINVAPFNAEELKNKKQEVIIQARQISGRVISAEDGSGLPGVNIIEKGTSNGAITDLEGRYSLNVAEGATLVFSSVGYLTREVAIGSNSTINLTMDPDVKQLEELVVVGYGVQKKANLTGATSSVNFEQLATRPAPNTATLLQGQLAGVTVSNFNAQPGNDNPEIRIRGVGTFNAGQNPLVIVDGVESSLSQIPAGDVESVSVLKDAASAAIYGVRAANGVILVTTKRGAAKKATVTLRQNYAIQEATMLPDMVDSWDYARIVNLSREAKGQSPLFTDEMIQTMRDGSDPDRFANTDWVEELFRPAPMNTTYLSVNGGSEDVRYLVSGEYFDQEGISRGTDTKRYSVRSNLDMKATNWLNIGLNLSGHYRKINETLNSSNESGGNSSIFYQMRRTSNPLVPVRYSNGQWGRVNGVYNQTNAIYPNSLYMADRGINSTDRYFLQGKIFAGAELVKNLKYTVNLSATYNSGLNTRFSPTEKVFDADGDVISENSLNQLQDNNRTDYRYIIENLLDYDLKLNDHQLHFLLGQAAQYYREDYLWASVSGLPNDLIHELGAGVQEKDVNGNAEEESLHSLFGRVNYNFVEKYLFEANIRYDKSSKIAPANRLGIFPSFSGAWVISNESFLKNSKIFSFLKLRASWGQIGNQEIGNYEYVQNINLGQDYIFGETLTAGAAKTELANDKLSWETTTISNVGLDMNFFNDRLQLVVDAFDKTSTDILTTLPIPSTLGNLGAPYQNIAEVKNTGVEFDIKYNNNFKSLNYFGGVNLSMIKNEIVDIAGQTQWLSNGSRNINLEGHPINSYYGLIAEGYYQDADEIAAGPTQFSALAPGDVKFRDISGPNGEPDGKIDETYDRTIIGSPFPKLTYAFNFGGSLKGFDLYCFFQGISGIKRYFWYNNEDVGNFTTAALDYWTLENPNAAYPRWGNQPNNNKNSTRWVKDASYLRLKSLEVGYSLSSQLISSIGLQKVRLYLTGNNLLTFTDVVDFDPEKIVADERNRVYPQSKIYSVGLNVTF